MRVAVLILVLSLCGCAGTPTQFSDEPPMWRDEEDFRQFGPRPGEYKVATIYDGIDETIFRPITRLLAVDSTERAHNVNSIDEVPDSSWFTNRIGKRPMSVDEIARGACQKPIDPRGPFTVLSSKPDGFNPGFLVQAPDGRKYFFKFDQHELQSERMSSAEVIGSLVYHAVGFTVPCYEVLYFDKGSLVIDKNATVKGPKGEKQKMTQADVDYAFSLVKLSPDGRVRTVSSLLLEGKPLGPWTYQGRRGDDPNDVVPHEHRREVRAGYVLASWLSHFDTRDQNTLATWIEDPISKRGYVRHNILDFGDSLGNLSDNDAISRRLGYAYYFDFPYFVEDAATLGILSRPWDTVAYGKSGPILGYYDIEHFEPDAWRPGYPNPAFRRMTEEDGAWMARIIARFTEAHIVAIVDKARIANKVFKEDLVLILKGRREKLLRRWLRKTSPLTEPMVTLSQGKAKLCVRDLALLAGMVSGAQRRYYARSLDLGESEFSPVPSDPSWVCGELPARPIPYTVIELSTESPHRPLRIHLASDKLSLRVVGLER